MREGVVKNPEKCRRRLWMVLKIRSVEMSENLGILVGVRRRNFPRTSRFQKPCKYLLTWTFWFKMLKGNV